MSESMRRSSQWVDVCMIGAKIVSYMLIVVGMLHLVVAGANLAVLGAIFFDAERQGTATVVAYTGALFVLLLASGMLGVWSSNNRSRMHAIWSAAASLACLIVLVAGLSTGCFGIETAAFGTTIVTAVNGIACFPVVMEIALCIAYVVLDRLEREEAALYGDVADDAAAVEEDESAYLVGGAAEAVGPAQMYEEPADVAGMYVPEAADQTTMMPAAAAEDAASATASLGVEDFEGNPVDDGYAMAAETDGDAVVADDEDADMAATVAYDAAVPIDEASESGVAAAASVEPEADVESNDEAEASARHFAGAASAPAAGEAPATAPVRTAAPMPAASDTGLFLRAAFEARAAREAASTRPAARGEGATDVPSSAVQPQPSAASSGSVRAAAFHGPIQTEAAFDQATAYRSATQAPSFSPTPRPAAPAEQAPEQPVAPQVPAYRPTAAPTAPRPDVAPQVQAQARPADTAQPQRSYAPGHVPVPKVARTAMPEGVPSRPVVPQQPEHEHDDMGEIEWVDFGESSRIEPEDEEQERGGFFGIHFGKRR